MVDKKIGQLLKEKRKLLKLNQEQVANIFKVSKDYVSKIEKGDRQPSDRTLLDIHKFLEGDKSNARPANLVPVYGSVPAGWPCDQTGVTAEEPIDWIAVEGSTNNIGALLVDGHSMFPDIKDGEYVLYTQDSDLKPGDWIVATDEFRRPMVKEYAVKDGEPWLVSVNPEYPSFKVNHHYQIVGRVIDIYSRRKARRGR